jgi:hypothetical protein
MGSRGNKNMLVKCALLGYLASAIALETDERQNKPLLRKRLEKKEASVAFESLWDHAAALAQIEFETTRLLEDDRGLQMSMSMPSPPPAEPTTSPPSSPPTGIEPTLSPAPTESPTQNPTGSPTVTPAPTRNTPPPTPRPTRRATPSPTALPTLTTPTATPRPTNTPTTLCYDGSLEDLLLMILSRVTEEDILQDPTTPQGMAFDYLLNDDPYLRNPCGKTTIQQRYGLTTLYFATEGESWTNKEGWLDEEQECAWFGVECDDNMRAQKLELGKSSQWFVRHTYMVQKLTHIFVLS